MKLPLQRLPFYLLILFLLASCGSKTKKTEEVQIEIENKEVPATVRAEKAVYDEVMEVHDMAMPKMDHMMRIKGQLQEKVDLLREQEHDTSQIQMLEAAITDLNNADEAMMQWMRNFKPKEGDSTQHEEIINYYKAQQQLIKEVHQQMEEAIANGKKLTQQ